jgi:taurine dioxygenase
MALDVTVQPQPCGALVRRIDLTAPLTSEQTLEVRSAWLAHQVLAFPDQPLTVDDLERFALTIGPYGPDPYFESIPGHPHVAQVNQYDAWTALPSALKATVRDRLGVHSARRGYSRQGRYGERDQGRSMAIRYDDSALATQTHPIARRHPETGRVALFVSPGYTIGIDGMPDDEGAALLNELFTHQAQPQFIYRHRWTPGMLVLWDNRCLVHAATGGYQGHRRLLHRITVGETQRSG